MLIMELKCLGLRQKYSLNLSEPLLGTWEGKVSVQRIIWTRTKQVLVGNTGTQKIEDRNKRKIWQLFQSEGYLHFAKDSNVGIQGSIKKAPTSLGIKKPHNSEVLIFCGRFSKVTRECGVLNDLQSQDINVRLHFASLKWLFFCFQGVVCQGAGELQDIFFFKFQLLSWHSDCSIFRVVSCAGGILGIKPI